MTTTVNYSWTLPTVGASVNTWGTLVNNILTDIDAKMVSKTDAQTLTNKTLDAPVITGGASISGNVSVAGNVLVTVPGGLGYGTGAGGTVTQATSKSTDVTLNKPSALITLNNASLAANSAVTFVFSSTSITATDALVINLVSGYAGTAADYSFSAVCAAGFAVVVVRNMTVGALAEAIVIKAIVVKGANA